MRVQRLQVNPENVNDITYALLDEDGEPISAISGFMQYLRSRGCSPHTLSAYAYDLLHFTRFLKEQQISYQSFAPAHALTFLEYLSQVPSRKPAQPLGLVLSTTTRKGNATTRLSAPTINRIFAAVSSFYEYLILSSQFTSGENPIQRVD